MGALRQRAGGNVYIYGSLTLVRSLIALGLLDELVLFVEPITLGGGKTLFPAHGQTRPFELVSAQTASTGVVICGYRLL